MRWLLAFFLGFSLVARAGGLDFSVGVPSAGSDQFMAQLGGRLEVPGLELRAGLLLGSPGGILAEGVVILPASMPMVSPYLGFGAAIGVTASDGGGVYRIELGRQAYAVFLAGVALPARGYRPYWEVAYYQGTSVNFTRFAMGFVMEVF